METQSRNPGSNLLAQFPQASGLRVPRPGPGCHYQRARRSTRGREEMETIGEEGGGSSAIVIGVARFVTIAKLKKYLLP